ncbi:MAG TPA: WbuC family cupin fold metalloprotein [Desulfuromonadales bacterium]|nr:WbuC family cupin fold metalloprotein [Desulfuromonadales bacterium]
MQLIDDPLLDALTARARQSPRGRMNHNLHASYDEPCQRLLNAMEPVSYVRPHRHLTPPKPECFLAVRGRLAAFIFADDGTIERVIPFAAGGATLGVDIPAGVWHAVVSLESGSVFFETKPGPYVPPSDKDFASWAPAEGSVGAADYLAALLRAVETLSAD